MDPISPISAGYTSQAASVQPNANIAQSTAGAATAGSASLTTTATSIESSQTISQLSSTVQQFMQSIGGNSEADKLLQFLIAAMILMALLDSQQDSGEQTMNQLAGGAGDRSQYIGIFSSSTTISIQQTTTSIVAGTGAGAFDTGGNTPSGTGGELDMTV